VIPAQAVVGVGVLVVVDLDDGALAALVLGFLAGGVKPGEKPSTRTTPRGNMTLMRVLAGSASPRAPLLWIRAASVSTWSL
jgi:hypothetical protein